MWPRRVGHAYHGSIPASPAKPGVSPTVEGVSSVGLLPGLGL